MTETPENLYIDGTAAIIANGLVPQESSPVYSPLDYYTHEPTKAIERRILAQVPQMTSLDSAKVLEVARGAWKDGLGKWPQLPQHTRLSAVKKFITLFKALREKMILTLMWEIAKPEDEARAEIDRTIAFLQCVLGRVEEMEDDSDLKVVGDVIAKIRHTPVGIVLVVGPSNYPLNETYCTLLPALLMGNIVILKVPRVGGLVHFLAMKAFRLSFPAGAINFITGSGRQTLPTLMQSGVISALAFVGRASSADMILSLHPHPHSLRTFLQMEGKNVAVVTASANIPLAVSECVSGALSFNGQRCTAIKIIFVHASIEENFLDEFIACVKTLPLGMPWDQGVKITPLLDDTRVSFLRGLVRDAIEKGARVLCTKSPEPEGDEIKRDGDNEDVREVLTERDGMRSNLMRPVILFPVTRDMRLWSEEQFGPVVPIVRYSNIEGVLQYFQSTKYGLQASVFSRDVDETSALVDALSTAVGRININSQCGRSPDALPFSGRRSSANCTLSVEEVITAFSVPTVLAFKPSLENERLIAGVREKTTFLSSSISRVDGNGEG